MAASSKIQDGLQEIREAEKCLKTGFLKWSPDYASAASHFDKAGLCFKIAKSYKQAKDTYIRASDAHYKNNALFHSAKALTLASGLAADLKDVDEAVELMKKACQMFRLQGSVDSASSSLVKAAKYCEPTHLHTAVELYKEAAALCEADEKPRDAASHLANGVRIALKSTNRLADAVDCGSQQIDIWRELENTPNVAKCTLTLAIIHLAMNDYVAADKCYKEAFQVPGFCETDEAEAIERLLKAFDDGDEEALSEVKAMPLVRHQEVEVAKLARQLKIPGGGGRVGKTRQAPISGTGLEAELEQEYEQQEEDDEFAGGLT